MSYDDRHAQLVQRRCLNCQRIFFMRGLGEACCAFCRPHGFRLEVLPLCGTTRDGCSCDRERGHDGAHRGYNAILDVPLFWK